MNQFIPPNGYDEYLMQQKKGGTPNPFYLISTQFIPRNFNDVIRWSRFVMTHSPTLMEAIRKLATYPITDFVIKTPNSGIKEKYKKILKSIRLKSFFNEVGFDHYTLGNVYVSIYFPIERYIVCPSCNSEYKYRDMKEVIKFKQFKFTGKCPRCNEEGVFTRNDRKSYSIEELNLIKWSVENVSVHRNPITNSTSYYYTIPNFVKKGIMTGDPEYIESTPWSLIEAVKDGKDYKFDNANFFHFRNITFGDMLNGYGIPPLISIYALVFYQALLRRANEAIAVEHLTPLRIISPKQGTGGADPSVVLNLENFRRRMEEEIRKFKKDPNHMTISPIPVDQTNIGGEGRALLISQELQFAEESILMGVGLPRELMAGTMNWTSSTVGLRLLENTMTNYVAEVTELKDWIITKINAYYGMTDVEIEFIPFKLMDDDETRQQLAAMLEKELIAPSTYLEAFSLDLDEELEKSKKDAAKLAAYQLDKEYLINITKFATARDNSSESHEDEDFSKAKDTATQYFQQIAAIPDESSQKHALMELRGTDPAIYQQVLSMIEQYHSTPTTAGPPQPTGVPGEDQGDKASGEDSQEPSQEATAGGTDSVDQKMPTPASGPGKTSDSPVQEAP